MTRRECTVRHTSNPCVTTHLRWVQGITLNVDHFPLLPSTLAVCVFAYPRYKLRLPDYDGLGNDSYTLDQFLRLFLLTFLPTRLPSPPSLVNVVAPT